MGKTEKNSAAKGTVYSNTTDTGEENKEINQLRNPPFVKKKGLPIIGKFLGGNKEIAELTTKELEEEHRQPEGIMLLLLRENMEAECFENVKPGLFDFTPSDGEERTHINITKGKIYNCQWGNETFKLIVAAEHEFNPLPYQTVHDSREVKYVIDNSYINKKKLESKPPGTEWGGIIISIAVAAAIIVGVIVISNFVFHVDVIQMITGGAKQATQQVPNNVPR